MIKLRMTVKKGQGIDFGITEGELLVDAVKRATESIPLDERKHEEVFQAVVNGNQIPHELWSLTKLRESDNVLIAPLIKGDDPAALFKQALLVVVTVVASAYLGPAGAGLTGINLGLATAAVSIGASLLLNALIPPPVPEIGALNGGGDLSSSQMYAISGQTNQTRKFGTVPKVYGKHKMYPIVAANPYTELETDPSNGKLIQYFYAIYDFGFGPMKIEDIKIGDTPLSDFSDVEYNLVDTGKPAVDEGDWDKETKSDFEFYKGDVSAESLAVVLDGNKSAGGPQDTWEAIRNSPANIDGVDQTISLTIVNPQGLYSYGTNGTQYPRSINLEIFFALVGTEDWYPFNDLTQVKDWAGVGGDQAYQDFPLEAFELAAPNIPLVAGYTKLFTGIYSNPDVTFWPNFSTRPDQVRTVEFGWAKGTTQFVVKDHVELQIGADFRWNKKALGKITNIQEYGPDNDYSIVTIDTPTSSNIAVFTFEEGYDGVDYRWREVNDFSATYPSVLNRLLGKAKITRQETGAVYSTFRFTPKNPGQYKVRLTRISTTSDASYQVADSLTWAQISTRFNRKAIQTTKRHLFMELRIRATNQLNGAIQNLSAVATSALNVYDDNTQTWSRQLTNNPAWVFCDLLTSEINKRQIGVERLDMNSIVEWAEFCDEVPDGPPAYDFVYSRFEANFVLDYQATLQSVINQVTSAAQGSINIVDGKYGILIDKRRTVPVQIFTQRNSRDFQSARVYARRPDAVKIKFVDPSIGWQVNETTVYDNGFTEANALDFDELTSFGCTNQEQAWRFGRYMIAQNRLRQETIAITVDFEHLICTRGDFVQFVQDVMKVGGHPARVKSIAGNVVTTDDSFDLAPGSYGYVFRGVDGIESGLVDVINSDTFELTGTLPAVGDLIIIGETDEVVFDCIVKSISPNDDMSAVLTLVEKADEIYDAESTDTFPDYDPQISTTTDSVAPPGEVTDLEVVDNGWECDGLAYRYFVDLDWDVPGGSAFEYYSILVDSGRGYTEVGQTRESEFSYTVDSTRLGIEHKFKVLAVSATGKKLDLGAVGFVSATPMSKTANPSNVEDFSSDITGEVIQLLWKQVDDCDVQEYLIRYTPVTAGATWEASIPLLRVNRETTLAATQARTGSYLIKAVDFNGNESAAPGILFTTVPSLYNLNVIDETTDFPDLEGVFDKTEDQGAGALVIRKAVDGLPTEIEYYPEGYYYYSETLDLGDIFVVRLQSLIQAEGFTSDDLMANWASLADVLSLANSRHSEWDVETQYRATNVLNVIADWNALSDIDTLAGGDPENFTEWRKFTIGDATGRIFQFRLRLISNKPSVTPRVFDGKIRADMPDRREEYRNITTVGGTATITYSTPFKGPGTSPVITVSVDDIGDDKWRIVSKDLEGFTIEFYDVNNDPVDKTFDAVVAGYGRQYSNVI